MKSLSVTDNIKGLKSKKEQFEKEILRLEGSISILESLIEVGIKDINIPEKDNIEVIDEETISSRNDTDASDETCEEI